MSRLCTGDYAYPISISDCVEFDRIDVNVGISKDCSVVTGLNELKVIDVRVADTVQLDTGSHQIEKHNAMINEQKFFLILCFFEALK